MNTLINHCPTCGRITIQELRWWVGGTIMVERCVVCGDIQRFTTTSNKTEIKKEKKNVK